MPSVIMLTLHHVNRKFLAFSVALHHNHSVPTRSTEEAVTDFKKLVYLSVFVFLKKVSLSLNQQSIQGNNCVRQTFWDITVIPECTRSMLSVRFGLLTLDNSRQGELHCIFWETGTYFGTNFVPTI